MAELDVKEKVSGSLPDEATIQRALQRLRDVIRAQGLRYSTVREAIARAAISYDGHFEVSDLVRELRARGVRGAHTTTVYRTLPLLVDVGLIGPALLSSSGERQFYERRFERPAHDHIICTTCGKVIEFEFEVLSVLQKDIARRFGFQLQTHVHELLGTCHECAQAADQSDEASD